MAKPTLQHSAQHNLRWFGGLYGGGEQCTATGRALLMVAANKMDAARAAVASFERQFPQSPQTRLLRASLLAKDGKVHIRKRPCQGTRFLAWQLA